MSAIRPLATITILALVCGFFYVKINEGPPLKESIMAESWSEPAPPEVPPLSAGTMAGAASPAGSAMTASTGTSLAPQWSGSGASVPTASTAQEPPTDVPSAAESNTAAGGSLTIPDLPAMPELPDLPSPSDAAQTETAPSATPPVGLPANIPTARYGDSAPPAATNTLAPPTATNSAMSDPTAAAGVTGRVPSFGTATLDAVATSNMDTGSTMSAGMSQPVGQSPVVDGSASRYGSDTLGATSFAEAWPAIQSALERGELARAHLLLSQWQDEPGLSALEAARVETLLSQLAGSVVYSTEHCLEPAYVVQPGDTLETIAGKYDVPWQLLAKINGIPSATQVQLGQQLKVVRGPFSAVVHLGKNELALQVGGRYAGKFPVTIDRQAVVADSQWQVEEKLVTPTLGTLSPSASAYAVANAPVERALVLRSAAGGAKLTIASSSTALAAAGAGGSPTIRLAPRDIEELSDILSVGSLVVVRR